jgi:4-aminobutyrate aminotransferase
VSTVYVTEPAVKLAKRIASITPGGKLTRSMFTNSGTEANETAIVAARCYTGSQEIIALRHSYHGRSNLAMTLTGVSAWKSAGSPLPGIVFAHNGYCYRCPFGLTYPDCEVRCARDVEDVIRTTTSGRVAAFIAEPIQGVGGFITPPKEYFAIVAGIVRRHGGLIISDEVQTAWGRTGGRWFGIEQWGVEPDILTAAKGIANGIPMGVTVARPEVADAFAGLTISTFGGNPVSCAAALATIEVIEEEGLLENARVQGARLRAGLQSFAAEHSCIGEVRGMGLMTGVEIVSGGEGAAGRAPAPDVVAKLFEETRRRGLLIGKGGFHGNVLRITPALTIREREIDEGLSILKESFAAARR